MLCVCCSRSLAWQGLPPAFLTLLGATEGPPTDKANEKVNGESTEAQGDGSSAALQVPPHTHIALSYIDPRHRPGEKSAVLWVFEGDD